MVGLDEDLVQIFSPVAPDRIEQTEITVTDLAAIGQVANLGVTDGTLSAVDPVSALLVNESAADEWGLSVGDPVDLMLVSGETLTVTVAAVFTETQPPFWDDWIIDQSLYEQTVAADAFEQWVASSRPGVIPRRCGRAWSRC